VAKHQRIIPIGKLDMDVSCSQEAILSQLRHSVDLILCKMREIFASTDYFEGRHCMLYVVFYF